MFYGSIPRAPQVSPDLRSVIDILLGFLGAADSRYHTPVAVHMSFKMFKRLLDEMEPAAFQVASSDHKSIMGLPLIIRRGSLMRLETKEQCSRKPPRSYTVPRLSAGSISSQPASPLTAS